MYSFCEVCRETSGSKASTDLQGADVTEGSIQMGHFYQYQISRALHEQLPDQSYHGFFDSRRIVDRDSESLLLQG